MTYEDGYGTWNRQTVEEDPAEIAANATDEYTVSFTGDDDKITLTGKSEEALTTSDPASDENPTSTAMLLLPQKIALNGSSHGDDGVAYLTLGCAIYNMFGDSYDPETDTQLLGKEGNVVTVYFPLAISWEPGKKYTYTFVFGGSGTGDADNHGGETDEEGPIPVPITFNMSVDEFSIRDGEIEEDVMVGYINGHRYIDLGLESGVLWAACNVGAASPEDCGDYYAWGETETKYDKGYTEENSRWYGMTLEEIAKVIDISGNSEYDAATANWGATWRMPKYDEMNELLVCSYTVETRTDSEGNSITGYKITGPNGNSIFLPAAGHYTRGIFYKNIIAYYWISTIIYQTISPYPGCFQGRPDVEDSFGITYRSPYSGYSVRPVADR